MANERVLAAHCSWRCDIEVLRHIGGLELYPYTIPCTFDTQQESEMLKHLEELHGLDRTKLDIAGREIYLK